MLTVPLAQVLKWDKTLFYSNLFLPILIPLTFHTDSESTLSIATKNPVVILIGIILNPWVGSRIDLFTMLVP